MRLRYLHLRNYRRHRDTRIEFPDGVLALLGRNGSGKSTVLEALGFALFGVPATRTSKELLRWDGAAPSDTVQVVLECELGNQAVRIVRELKGKNLTPNATLTLDGAILVAPGAGSNEAVTQEVQKRLGMDRDGFFTTVVARQKELARLADLGPADRKRLILGMLGVDALDRAINTARGHRKQAETRVETLRGELPDRKALRADRDAAAKADKDGETEVATRQTAWQQAKDALATAHAAFSAREKEHEARRLAEADLADAERRLADAARLRDGLLAHMGEARAAQAQADALQEAAGRLPALQEAQDRSRRYREVQEGLVRSRQQRDAVQVPEVPDGRLEVARAGLAAVEADLVAAREAKAVAENEAKALQNRLRRLATLGEDAPCPTCERPLQDHLPALRGRLEQESESHVVALADRSTLVGSLQARHQDAVLAVREAEAAVRLHEERSRERARLDAAVREAEALLSTLGEVPDAEALRQDLAAALAAHDDRLRHLARAERLPGLEAEHGSAVEAVAAATASRDKAQAALAVLPETGDSLDVARRAHLAAAETERQAERTFLDAQNRSALARRGLEDATRRLEDADARAGRLAAAEEEARYWAALAGGRGRGLLESFKDHLVARIGPAVSDEASRLLARFTNGRYNEVLLDAEYRLYVADGGVHYTLDRFSGGESDLVHLALRLAVSRLLLERSGGPELRFLALDEVFGSLDDERRRLVLGALQELGGLYTQVLLVTHHDSLRDSLDAAMLVEDRDGEAVVTLRNG